jgi:uncharacterized membrane protein
MEKYEVITFIQDRLQKGIIAKSDLAALIGEPAPVTPPSSVASRHEVSKNIINVFYGIGALIAIIGVVILIAQHWEDIGFAGRILVTLGIGAVTYMAGILLKEPQQNAIAQIMFTIAAILAPLGVYVLLDEAHIAIDWSVQFSIAMAFFILFGAAWLIAKRNILTLITIGWGTWSYYVVLNKVFEYMYTDAHLMQWATMVIGITYICIAYSYYRLNATKEQQVVQGILYALGTGAILGAGISIGGTFDIVFIAFIFAAFYASVFVRSRAMLMLAALFLIGHVIKLTSKYFSDSLNWSLALIVVGFLVIGIGYMTFMINKRFLGKGM